LPWFTYIKTQYRRPTKTAGFNAQPPDRLDDRILRGISLIASMQEALN
jgi:hypothetical protein